MADEKILNEAEDDDIMVTLDMDDGTQVDCEILTIFDVNDQDYIALLPITEENSEEEGNEVYIYRYYEDEEGNPSLENIQTDEEYEAVEEKFDMLLDDAACEEA